MHAKEIEHAIRVLDGEFKSDSDMSADVKNAAIFLLRRFLLDVNLIASTNAQLAGRDHL